MARVYPVAMRKTIVLGSVALAVVVATSVPAAAPSPLELDHVWIVVSPDAPERAALERAGFRMAPSINRHDGQGTASITFEFENAYLELIWPDSTVPVAPGSERAAEKFKQRMFWRTSGWCPIGVGLRRTTPSDDPLPFPTWSVAPAWLPAGSAIEILSPRDDTRSPSLFISPRVLTVNEKANLETIRSGSSTALQYGHPIGVHRVTAIRLVSPTTYRPIEPLTYLQKLGVLGVEQQGKEWLLELTFDGGKKGESKDLRPDIPLVLRY